MYLYMGIVILEEKKRSRWEICIFMTENMQMRAFIIILSKELQMVSVCTRCCNKCELLFCNREIKISKKLSFLRARVTLSFVINLILTHSYHLILIFLISFTIAII